MRLVQSSCGTSAGDHEHHQKLVYTGGESSARRRRAALGPMLCGPSDASAFSDMAAANQEIMAAARAARRAHRSKLERTWHVYFSYAATAYDPVPQTLLLHRLL